MSKRTLVTSALPYANGPIHLGHLAGAYLPADLFTRYRRLRGDDVIHICGSDEHGVPITIAAEKEGVSPQQIVDRFHNRNKKIFRDIGISFDYYGRTTSPVHHETSRAFFKTLYDKGVFKKKTERQLYDEDAEMFLPDRYVTGICPVCGNDGAHGDQCEKCGSSLSPTELKNPKSALTGNIPVTKETEHWYLPLGKFQPDIEHWIESKTDWKSNVLGQCK
ncbi:MAG: class I tRNA ligase family protein, partial [Balneolaceae bacterium]